MWNPLKLLRRVVAAQVVNGAQDGMAFLMDGIDEEPPRNLKEFQDRVRAAAALPVHEEEESGDEEEQVEPQPVKTTPRGRKS